MISGLIAHLIGLNSLLRAAIQRICAIFSNCVRYLARKLRIDCRVLLVG